eukprot:3406624-Pyramimonas_sp.AAC.2
MWSYIYVFACFGRVGGRVTRTITLGRIANSTRRKVPEYSSAGKNALGAMMAMASAGARMRAMGMPRITLCGNITSMLKGLCSVSCNSETEHRCLIAVDSNQCWGTLTRCWGTLTRCWGTLALTARLRGQFLRLVRGGLEARVYSHDGPIRHRKRGYILPTEQ